MLGIGYHTIFALKKQMEQSQMEIVENALSEALYLISDEIQCVMDEELQETYQRVIEQLEEALDVMKAQRR